MTAPEPDKLTADLRKIIRDCTTNVKIYDHSKQVVEPTDIVCLRQQQLITKLRSYITRQGLGQFHSGVYKERVRNLDKKKAP